MTTTREIAYKYRWVIMWILWIAYTVIFMQRLSIAPLTPFIKEEMELTSTQMGSLMSAIYFGYMISIYPGGWAVDRLGIRLLLIAGELIGGIFMIGMFLTPSYGVALILMAMAGFGCGYLLPATSKGVILWFPLRERATVMGFKQTAVNVGGIVTAAMLPWVALAWGWRYGFLILGIVAIVTGIVSYILYKDPPKTQESNVIGCASKIEAPNSTTQKSALELLKSLQIWLASLIGFTMGIVEFAIIGHLVLYLTENLSLSVVTAGALLAVLQAGGAVGKPGGGFISDRLLGGKRKGVLILWAGIACITCLLIVLQGEHLSLALYPVLFLMGLGAAGWGGVYLTLVSELVDTEMTGRAIGFTCTFNMAGFVVGPIAFGRIVDTTGSYPIAWLFCAIFAAISVIVSLFLKEKRKG